MSVWISKRRLQQLTAHLKDANAEEKDFENVPKVKKVAESSTGWRVKDKVAIITGTNSLLGIGRATAHQFAQNGARAVFICDLNDSLLEAHKREIEAKYPDVAVHARKFDAADEDAIKAVVGEAVEKYGRLDIMFANAGIGGTSQPFAEISKESFMRTMNTNTLSVFLATKHAAPAMLLTSPLKPHPSGSILATSSIAASRSNAGPADYSASKAAITSLMQSAAFQLPHPHIRCNAICPGNIETEMTESFLGRGGRESGVAGVVERGIPMRRIAVADEVARVALFLASGEASWVNGQAWNVCGGFTAGYPIPV